MLIIQTFFPTGIAKWLCKNNPKMKRTFNIFKNYVFEIIGKGVVNAMTKNVKLRS